ncbi:MAG: hypothetical protein ACHQO8_10005 [Vicinamibacterales bacterium]
MFISFLIPSVFEHTRARHLLVFYKQLGAFARDEMAFVGEPDYFRSPAELQAEGRPEWNASWRDAYEYEPPVSLDDVQYRALPGNLFATRLRRVQSSWKLYGQMVTRRLPELEAAFSAAVESLTHRGPIQGLMAFANNPSVSFVARRRGLPVVHTEFGPLRKPAYVMTGYWDLRGVSRGTDAVRRFRNFRRAATRGRVPLLSREELLHTLRRLPLPDAPGAADAPFRLGVALQGEDNAHVQGINALDVLSVARQRFHRDEILVRYHPGGLSRYSDTLGVTDTSADSTAFIQKCETILTVNSGTALEAMLLGRRAVVLGDSPFRIAADRSFDTATRLDDAQQLLALNFLVFGYIVPAALMFDPDYTRWRLSHPSELEIYRHHQRWYRAQLMQCEPPDEPALALSTAAKLLNAVPRGDGPARAVIFGAGQTTPALVDRLRPERFSLLGLFDNDRAKWGAQVAGLTISPPAYRDDTTVVVSSLTHADAIVGQLHMLGYPSERILRLR